MSSNEPRDQLTADLAAHKWRNSPRAAHSEHNYDGGCAICRGDVEVIASTVADLGWCPPPRVITHPDELIALRDGSVVLHSPCSDQIGSACVWVKGCGWWSTNSDGAEYDAYDIDGHCGEGETLTVLIEPEKAGR